MAENCTHYWQRESFTEKSVLSVAVFAGCAGGPFGRGSPGSFGNRADQPKSRHYHFVEKIVLPQKHDMARLVNSLRGKVMVSWWQTEFVANSNKAQEANI